MTDEVSLEKAASLWAADEAERACWPGMREEDLDLRTVDVAEVMKRHSTRPYALVYVTLFQLEVMDACMDQRELFAERFPYSYMAVSRQQAASDSFWKLWGFDLNYFACCAFRQDRYDFYRKLALRLYSRWKDRHYRPILLQREYAQDVMARICDGVALAIVMTSPKWNEAARQLKHALMTEGGPK